MEKTVINRHKALAGCGSLAAVSALAQQNISKQNPGPKLVGEAPDRIAPRGHGKCSRIRGRRLAPLVLSGIMTPGKADAAMKRGVQGVAVTAGYGGASDHVWGLAAFGADGVQSVVEMLQTDLARNLGHCETPTIKSIAPSKVKAHLALAPRYRISTGLKVRGCMR